MKGYCDQCYENGSNPAHHEHVEDCPYCGGRMCVEHLPRDKHFATWAEQRLCITYFAQKAAFSQPTPTPSNLSFTDTRDRFKFTGWRAKVVAAPFLVIVVPAAILGLILCIPGALVMACWNNPTKES